MVLGSIFGLSYIVTEIEFIDINIRNILYLLLYYHCFSVSFYFLLFLLQYFVY